MTNPGPPGEDERPLAGPAAGMGLPESGTQHATSTDFDLPLDRPAEGDTDPMLTTPPLAQPTPPAYDDPADLVRTVEPVEPTTTVPTDVGGAGGLLGKVKAFADQRPAAFLAAALVAGWIVGKLLSSFGEDEDD